MVSNLAQINFGLVFLEGILSFFSPCVLPLLPVYLSLLAGENGRQTEGGQTVWRRGTMFGHTVCFILGISAAFFLLGFSFSAVGQFFGGHKALIQRIGGLLILLFGIAQLGLLTIPALQRERRLKIHGSLKLMNPVTAFVLGFTFSFAWTPCVGPALSSVLLMASGEGSFWQGAGLILLYTLGFVIPFLVLGLFTTQVLYFIQKRKNILRYAQKIGGAVLVIIGVFMVLGLGSFPQAGTGEGQGTSSSSTGSSQESSSQEPWNMYDFTLQDQSGKTHSLSEYRGKIVVLNFWTTWCGYCKQEMPDLEELYAEYGKNSEDVVILGVASPTSQEYPNNADISKQGIQQFLSEKGYTFPVVFDETGLVLESYMVESFPTTYIIGRDSKPMTYIPGMLPKEQLKSIIEQARQE